MKKLILIGVLLLLIAMAGCVKTEQKAVEEKEVFPVCYVQSDNQIAKRVTIGCPDAVMYDTYEGIWCPEDTVGDVTCCVKRIKDNMVIISGQGYCENDEDEWHIKGVLGWSYESDFK